jgi:hypothetical protein
MIVMAIMAVLMGLGVGWLQNIGRAGLAQQARSILRETAFACKQSSNGETQATFELRWKQRPDGPVLVVGATTASPVLTHHFERIDAVSMDYPLRIHGDVEAVDEGYVGRAARYRRGAYLELEPQSAFAMTEGLSLDVRLNPESGATAMTIVRGEGAYDVALVRSRAADAYDVRLRLNLKSDDQERSVASTREFVTAGGPVRADGTWSHLQVHFDGERVSVRVDGIERMPQTATRRRTDDDVADTAPPTRQRLAVPEGGAVRLFVSTPDASFSGRMDSLVLGGVFRASDVERELRGLEVLRPKLPLRVTFLNGRLDPALHADDVIVVLREAAAPNAPAVRLRMGLHGTIEDDLGSAAP